MRDAVYAVKAKTIWTIYPVENNNEYNDIMKEFN